MEHLARLTVIFYRQRMTDLKWKCGVCDSTRYDETRFKNIYLMGADLVRCTRCGTKSYRWTRPPAVGQRDFYNTPAYDAYTRRHVERGSPSFGTERTKATYRKASAAVYTHLITTAQSIAVGPTTKLFEVGCAWGHLLSVGKELGLAVAGCDLGRENVKRAVEAGYNVEHGVFLECSVDAPIDIVVSNDVIEHTATPGPDLRRMFEVLRPGGVLAIKTFYDEWHETLELDLWKPRRKCKVTGYFGPISHPFHFESDVLHQILRRIGFTVEQVDYSRACGQFTTFARKP